MTVAGKTVAVQLVRVPPGAYRIRVGLARGRVGATDPLAAIAGAHGAEAAINGCFFNAYTRDAIKAPYNHIITRGQLVHTGNTGVTLGFDRRGHHRMERMRIRVQGSLDANWKHPDNWYAYFLNHPVESANAAILYTSHWVGGQTPDQGIQVVVRRGVVQAVGSGSHAIPPDGFVLVLAGRERYMAGRFRPGRRAAYRLAIEASDRAFWDQAQEALGCGPRLLRAGEVSVDPTGEGFSHPKILSLSGARSAVGATRGGALLLVATSSITIEELARVMQTVGAHDAMNLDGGASSGLWVRGRYLTTPGRDISHALLVLRHQ